MPIGGGLALGDLLFSGLAAAPEVAAAAAPEVAAAAAPEIAGAIALPTIDVIGSTAAEAGAGAALGGGAATAAGAGAADLGLGGLAAGLGGLGIGSALAGGTTPSTVVGGEFGALPSTAATGTTPYKISSSPFVGGAAPLPTPRPGGIGGTGPGSPGSAPALTVQQDSTVNSGGPGGGVADFGQPDLGYAQFNNGVQTGIQGVGPVAQSPTAGSGGIGDFFSNNKGLLTLLGLGVGGQLLSPAISNALGLNKVPGDQNLKNLAQQESNLASQQSQYGTALEQPLLTGVLPPGQQQAVTNALNDAITTIKGRYGALGLSGSSMEADAIANAKNRSTEAAANIEQQMAQTGQQAVSTATSNLGLESQIYDTLLSATIQQDQQLGNAISRFATAVGAGSAIKSGGLNFG